MRDICGEEDIVEEEEEKIEGDKKELVRDLKEVKKGCNLTMKIDELPAIGLSRFEAVVNRNTSVMGLDHLCRHWLKPCPNLLMHFSYHPQKKH